MPKSDHGFRGWVTDVAIGGIGGGLVTAVIVLNLFIFSGLDDGYETSLSAAFAENAVVGLLALGLLVAGPVIGVWLARRRRAHREPGPGPDIA